ncbi:MAG: cell division protein FtsY [Labilithrix sp.]|nr:cell division protein FtsY [Labilithrix sp.]
MRNNPQARFGLPDISARSRADSIPIPVGDRRRHPRYALSLAITLQGDNNFYAGLSEDISEGGVFIATHHLLAIGTPVVLSFTLPFSEEPLSVLGTVAWVRGPTATAKTHNVFGGSVMPGVIPGIGIRFDHIDPEALGAIRDFMRHRRPVFFDA